MGSIPVYAAGSPENNFNVTFSRERCRARFGEAGLREPAIESEVVAEGSTRVMSGKHYNRAVLV